MKLQDAEAAAAVLLLLILPNPCRLIFAESVTELVSKHASADAVAFFVMLAVAYSWLQSRKLN